MSNLYSIINLVSKLLQKHITTAAAALLQHTRSFHLMLYSHFYTSYVIAREIGTNLV